MESVMDTVSRYGLMELATRDSGDTMSPAAEVNSSTLTVTFTMVNGRMIKPTDTESTPMPMALATRVSGLMISNTVKAKRPGSTVASTMVSTITP